MFSIALGLITAGVLVAVLTVVAFVEVGE